MTGDPRLNPLPDSMQDRMKVLARDLAYSFKIGEISPRITITYRTGLGEVWDDLTLRESKLKQYLNDKWLKLDISLPPIAELENQRYVYKYKKTEHSTIYILSLKTLNLISNSQLKHLEEPFVEKLDAIARELADGYKKEKWSSTINIQRFLGGNESWRDPSNPNSAALADFQKGLGDDRIIPGLHALGYLDPVYNVGKGDTFRMTRTLLDAIDFPFGKRVFIAYSSRYKYVTDKIAKLLGQEHQFDVFWDKDLRPAKMWQDEIEREIEERDMFIYILTPESINSQYCRKEYNHAVAYQRRIIPILLHEDAEAALPEPLSKLQFVRFTHKDSETSEIELLHALKEGGTVLTIGQEISELSDTQQNRGIFETINNLIHRVYALTQTQRTAAKHGEIDSLFMQLDSLCERLHSPHREPLITHIQHMKIYIDKENWEAVKNSTNKAYEIISQAVWQ